MNLTQIIRAVQRDLPITMKHDKWLANHSNATYSDEAVAFAKEALAGVYTFRKRMRFRSSSTGMCDRRRIFAAIGVPEPSVIDSKLANIFHTGNFLHLKWQMAGLTEGWLKQAEVIVDDPNVNMGGTLDGVLDDGSGFEFKSINDRGFASVWQDPKPIHVRQVHTYMYLSEHLPIDSIDKFSIVYENKNTQEWREFRVERDAKIIKEIDREVGVLNAAWNDRKLPVIKSDCSRQVGTEYRQCPFKDMCLTTKRWPTVYGAK